MTYVYLALSVLLILTLASRLALPHLERRLGRIPSDDQAAIDLFLANRDETSSVVKKEIWRAGPSGRFANANIYGLPSGGRFYSVLALDADNQRYRHSLAATGQKAQHDFRLLQQNSEGYWTQVLQ
jgi:hypothetical protein